MVHTSNVRRGFTLLETIIAIGVLLLSIVGPLALVQKSLKSSGTIRQQFSASYLLQDAMEYIKNARDADLINNTHNFQNFTTLCASQTCWVDTTVSGNFTEGNAYGVCTNGTCSMTRGGVAQTLPTTGSNQVAALRQNATTKQFGYNSSAGWNSTLYLRTVDVEGVPASDPDPTSYRVVVHVSTIDPVTGQVTQDLASGQQHLFDFSRAEVPNQTCSISPSATNVSVGTTVYFTLSAAGYNTKYAKFGVNTTQLQSVQITSDPWSTTWSHTQSVAGTYTYYFKVTDTSGGTTSICPNGVNVTATVTYTTGSTTGTVPGGPSGSCPLGSDIMLLADLSGSMTTLESNGQSKYQNLKTALNYTVNKIFDQSAASGYTPSIGLAVFGGSGGTGPRVLQHMTTNRTTILNAIANLPTATSQTTLPIGMREVDLAFRNLEEVNPGYGDWSHGVQPIGSTNDTTSVSPAPNRTPEATYPNHTLIFTDGASDGYLVLSGTRVIYDKYNGVKHANTLNAGEWSWGTCEDEDGSLTGTAHALYTWVPKTTSGTTVNSYPKCPGGDPLQLQNIIDVGAQLRTRSTLRIIGIDISTTAIINALKATAGDSAGAKASYYYPSSEYSTIDSVINSILTECGTGGGTTSGGTTSGAPASNPPALANLVSQWHFDEGTGTVADDAVGSNNGTLTNGPTWVTGRKGAKAVHFDGVNDSIEMGSASSLDNLSSFTFAAWVKPDSLPTGVGVIMDKGASGTLGYKRFTLNSSSGTCGTGSTGCIELTVNRATTNASAVAVPNSLPAASWSFVSVTYDPTNGPKIYVNGNEVTYKTRTVGSGTTADDSAEGLHFGKFPSGASPFLGSLDEGYVYNKALSATEVGQLYSASQ